jgi:hypothetical protein
MTPQKLLKIRVNETRNEIMVHYTLEQKYFLFSMPHLLYLYSVVKKSSSMKATSKTFW